MDIVTNFIADTTQMKAAEQTVKKVGVESEKTAKKVSNLGKNMRMTKGPTSALSTTAGQLGVQIQDVAVQAQMGTDAVRIFSQQGPQILSIFGPTGAVFGALAAIGAVVGQTIVSAFGLGKDAIEEFGKSVKAVGVTIRQTESDTYALSNSILDLAEKSEVAARLEIAIALNAAGDAADYAREAISELGIEGVGMYRSIEDVSDATQTFIKLLDDIRDRGEVSALSMRDLRKSAEELGVDFAEVTNVAGLFMQAVDPDADGQSMVAFTEQLGILAQKTNDPAFLKFAKTLLDTAITAAETEEQAQMLKQAYEDLSGAIDEANFNQKEFNENAERFMEGVRKTRFDNIVKAYEERTKAEEKAAKETQRQAEEDAKLKDKEVERVKKFQQAINKNRFELIVQGYEERVKEEQRQAEEDQKREEERQKFMDGINKQRFENIQNAANERRKREAEERLKQEEEEIKSRERVTNGLLSLEDKLMKGKSEKQKAAFRLGVNLANAEKRENAKTILSDSYTAAMKAYKSLAGIPFIGPALGAAAAGVIIAAGASYATQSLAGRALGGQVRDGESYVVGERGPEVLTMGSSGRIIPNDKLRGEQQVVNKTANITFQVNTVDARGFDQLLQSRRGQIISMVNTAMNDKGRRGVV